MRTVNTERQKGQKRVSILKKMTVLCPSGSFYSTRYSTVPQLPAKCLVKRH